MKKGQVKTSGTEYSIMETCCNPKINKLHQTQKANSNTTQQQISNYVQRTNQQKKEDNLEINMNLQEDPDSRDMGQRRRTIRIGGKKI